MFLHPPAFRKPLCVRSVKAKKNQAALLHLTFRAFVQFAEECQSSALDEDAPQYDVVRFKISGEPFDLPMSLLREWPETLLSSSASFAILSGQFDPVDRHIPLVELPRDVKFFRIIRHYMETRELITPPTDSLDRQLLIAEAGFYAFPAIINELLTGHRYSALMRPARQRRKINSVPNQSRLAVVRFHFSLPDNNQGQHDAAHRILISDLAPECKHLRGQLYILASEGR